MCIRDRSITKTISSPEVCQLKDVGLTNLLRSTYKAPAKPVIAPDITKAVNLSVYGLRPNDFIFSSFSLQPFKKFPKFQFITQFKIIPTIHKQAKQIIKKFNGSIVFIENRSFLTYVDKPSSPPYFVQPTEK